MKCQNLCDASSHRWSCRREWCICWASPGAEHGRSNQGSQFLHHLDGGGCNTRRKCGATRHAKFNTCFYSSFEKQRWSDSNQIEQGARREVMGGDEVGPVVVAAVELSARKSAARTAMVMMWRAIVGTLFTCTHTCVASELNLQKCWSWISAGMKAWTIYTMHSKRRHRVATNIDPLRPIKAARI